MKRARGREGWSTTARVVVAIVVVVAVVVVVVLLHGAAGCSSMIVLVLVALVVEGSRFPAWLRRQNKNQGQIKPRGERGGPPGSLLLRSSLYNKPCSRRTERAAESVEGRRTVDGVEERDTGEPPCYLISMYRRIESVASPR